MNLVYDGNDFSFLIKKLRAQKLMEEMVRELLQEEVDKVVKFKSVKKKVDGYLDTEVTKPKWPLIKDLVLELATALILAWTKDEIGIEIGGKENNAQKELCILLSQALVQKFASPLVLRKDISDQVRLMRENYLLHLACVSVKLLTPSMKSMKAFMDMVKDNSDTKFIAFVRAACPKALKDQLDLYDFDWSTAKYEKLLSRMDKLTLHFLASSSVSLKAIETHPRYTRSRFYIPGLKVRACYNCADPGHLVNRCPKPLCCFACGESDHTVDTCTSPASSQKEYIEKKFGDFF